MNRAVTLRDVADAADVHPSTASRALNPGTRNLVNAQTVARVLAAAAELGYLPNALAQGLKGSRTMTVGMVIPDLTNPLFPPIVRGLEDRCGEAGYTVLLANTDNDATKERNIFEVMARRRVDGLVIATARLDRPLATDGLRSDFPVVLVNRTTDQPHVPSVSGDDHAGVGLAVRHLADLGHRRIGHLAGTSAVSPGLQRHQSFLSWMNVQGIEVTPDMVVWCSWFSEEAGAAALRELLDRDLGITAVFAASDRIALGCYDVAAERGLRIPEDLSIVGYNDVPFADRLSPPMTTVCLPHYQIGVRAAELILEAIADPGSVDIGVRLPPQLKVRGSTGPPRTT